MDAFDIFMTLCYVGMGVSAAVLILYVIVGISARRQEKRADEDKEEMPDRQRIILRERRLLTASMRYDVLRRDGFRCQICGATQKDGVLLHVDHIVPVSRGGRTEMSNLRTLCDRCNLGKGDKIEKRISE